MRRGWRLLVVLVAGLLVAGCGTVSSPEDGQPQFSPAPSASSATLQGGRGLVPSGLTVVGGGSGVKGLVADASGGVWATGPWQVARLDPGTGSARVWSVSDDLGLARAWPVTGAWPMAGTPGAGVWLVAHDRVLLFDGSGFARELVVPQRFGVPAAVVGRGDGLWVRTESGVLLEWGGEAWADRGATFGPLVVDSEGVLWSGGRQRQPDGSWVTPEGSQAPPDGLLNVMVADPESGVWGVGQEGLYRYDGARWSSWALPAMPGTDEAAGGWYPASMSTGGGGAVWLAGESAVVRRDEQGAWTTFTSEQGLTVAQPLGFGRQVLVVGAAVLVTDPTGVLRLDGGRFVPLWADPAAAAIGPAGCLHAVSGAQVWVSAPARPSPGPPVPWPDYAPLAHFADGSWTDGGPGVRSCLGIAVGPDAAIWAISGDGLVRYDGRDWATVDGSITSGPLAVGPDGVAWALSGDRLVRFDPDGTRTVIGRTPLGSAPRGVLLSSGQPGVVWVGTNAMEMTPEAARWDGQWTKIPVDAWSLQILATPDGALWAEASNNETGWLIRYADGRWSEVPESRGRGIGGSLASSPTGEVCVKGGDSRGRDAMTCYDADGLSATVALPELSAEVSIGSDGAAWVLGEQVARLPDDLLPWAVDPAG